MSGHIDKISSVRGQKSLNICGFIGFFSIRTHPQDWTILGKNAGCPLFIYTLYFSPEFNASIQNV